MTKYRFNPDDIHQLAAETIAQQLPRAQMFDVLINKLRDRYPKWIHPEQPWIYNNAGGAMIQMKMLYASSKEYILLFGTPIGTEGHSGRNPAEYYDTVLDGEAWYYHEGQFEREVHKTGDRIYVARRQSAGMHIPDHVWMIEYARGALPRLMPFGLADILFSTLDYHTLRQTLKVYIGLNLRRPPKYVPPPKETAPQIATPAPAEVAADS
jgi:C-8 sterol isomerase